MEEQQHQIKFYGFMLAFIYAWIAMDVYLQCFAGDFNHNRIIGLFNQKMYRLDVISNAIHSHLALLVIIACVSFATRAKKDLQFDIYIQFWYPFLFGLLLFIFSVFAAEVPAGLAKNILYITTYLTGAIFLHTSLSNLTKIITTRLKEDIWNVEEESFEQNQELQVSNTIFNIPMQFYYKKKVHNGWININPFRGLMVLGVPGSGKSESVIVPFIKQFLEKGTSMLIYDFKFPTLGEIAYYHYMLNKEGSLRNHTFHCVNLDNIEYSRRINPISAQYINSLSDAGETADAIVTALKKSDKGGGNDQFFTQSAINFLAACLYFLSKYERGKYSDMPHLLAFIAQPYDRVFNSLFSMIELHSLLSPFKSAYDNKAFDQLEGQIGTLRINISRLATKESFWVFGDSDFDLKISNPKSLLVLANSPQGQNVNSAFFAAILMRTISLVNSPGNDPCAIVVDECPTVFLHKVDNLIATARSNKVAVVLGAQELTQFQQQYGKDTANTIVSIMGSVLSGKVSSKETLDWLEKQFGKIKQLSTNVSIDRSKTSVTLNERMDSVIPASKIANQNTGELVGIVSRDNQNGFEKYQTNSFKCKVTLDLHAINEEKKHYRKLPRYYNFGNEQQKNDFLMKNMQRVFDEVREMTNIFTPAKKEDKYSV
jgi:hypothetical protein